MRDRRRGRRGDATAKPDSTKLTGAGSTLVEPLVSQWIQPVGRALGYQLVYGAVGSGAGIQSISDRTVDFGASDAPLSPDQATACHGCVQIPWALSATTLSFNVPGAPAGLHLTGPVVAGIFLGTITRWSDPRIAKLNPKVPLPDLKITPAFRSDGSGDTYAFTDYLSRVSPAWKSKVGNSTSVSFPAGIGAKGNDGVAGVVENTPGAIGYISVAYALTNRLKVAAVQNSSGVFARPGLPEIAAAAAAVKKVPANNEMHIVDPPKASRLAYPISTYTYVILPTSTPKAVELRRFVGWALTHGQAFGPRLVFAKLPKTVLAADEKTLRKVQAT
jgi:phosphate transport system substrate-binding protein